jgi:hypothetical protein
MLPGRDFEAHLVVGCLGAGNSSNGPWVMTARTTSPWWPGYIPLLADPASKIASPLMGRWLGATRGLLEEPLAGSGERRR